MSSTKIKRRSLNIWSVGQGLLGDADAPRAARGLAICSKKRVNLIKGSPQDRLTGTPSSRTKRNIRPLTYFRLIMSFYLTNIDIGYSPRIDN